MRLVVAALFSSRSVAVGEFEGVGRLDGRTEGPVSGATIRCNDDEEMTEPSAREKFKLNESSD